MSAARRNERYSGRMKRLRWMPSGDQVRTSNGHERAEAAGERDEGVGESGHRGLALVHAVDEAELGEAGARARAAAAYSGRAPEAEPQKTQTRFTAWRA